MSFVTLIGSVVKTTINIQCLVQQSHVTHLSPIDVRVKISQLKWICQLPRCPWEWMHPKQHRALSRQALKRPIRVFIPLLIHTAMAELSEPRGSKRICTRKASSKDQTMPAWRRMCSKLLIQQHLSLTMKLMINLAMPLMFLFKQVLSMMVRVAEIEEMEVMQDLMGNMMKEKKKMEKGQGSKRGSSKESLESFELISECNTMTPSRKPKNSKRTRSPMDPNASSSHGVPQVIPNHVTKSCFCNLVPIQYTCRKEGRNVMISGAPNNRHLGTGASTSNGWKTHYKAQEYEKMYDRLASLAKSPKPKDMKSVQPSSSTSSETEEPSIRLSPSSSPKPRGSRKSGGCSHNWNARGTNAHQRMRTCTNCGLQEITKHKDQSTIQRWVDPSSYKAKKTNKNKTPIRSMSP